MKRSLLAALLLVAALALAACGGGAAADAGGSAGRCPPDAVDCVDTGGEETPPSTGMCAPGVTDCVDVVVDADGDLYDSDAARVDAQALLGVAEAELDDTVRIARRGDEQFMLTEDYVLGRFTVELDEDGSGTYRVVRVTVELPDGPETFVS